MLVRSGASASIADPSLMIYSLLLSLKVIKLERLAQLCKEALVAMPFVPSSDLLLVVMPGATFVASDRSVPSDALCQFCTRCALEKDSVLIQKAVSSAQKCVRLLLSCSRGACEGTGEK